MTIRDNFPSIEPSLVLDFVNSGYIDPRITFSRNDATPCATYYDRSGILRVAPANFPRIDYDPVTLTRKGLLIEGSRLNLATKSEEFEDAVWSKPGSTTCSSNVIVSPDGTVSADKLVEFNGSANQAFERSATLVIGTQYVISIFVKAAERTQCRLAGRFSSNWSIFPSARFDLSNGTVLNSTGDKDATIDPIGNGWYRCSIYGTSANSTSGGMIISPLLNGGTTSTYAGNGVSGIYIWGAQIEAGAFLTSYIPTTSNTVTRNFDSAIVNNLSPWYNQSQGTLYLEAAYNGELYGGAYSTNVVQLDDGTGNNYITMRVVRDPSSPQLDEILRTSNVAQVDTAGIQPVIAGNIYKRAFAYATNNSRGAVNGVYTSTGADTNCAIPTALTRLSFTAQPIDSARQCMHIRKFAYYPVRHPDAQLLSLTSS